MNPDSSALSSIVQQAVGLNGLVAELHALPLQVAEGWGEGACISAKLEQAIKANRKGLGNGG
jgi:hypothetical protein